MKQKHIVCNVIVVVVLFTTIILSVFIDQINKATEKTIKITIEEVAAHDIKTIEHVTNEFWNGLSEIYTRLSIAQGENIEEIQELIKIEESTARYMDLRLIDENGNMYGPGSVEFGINDECIKEIVEGKEKIAISDNDERNCIFVAVRQEEMVIDGIKFIGISAKMPSESMEKTLKFGVFKDEGYITIIDKEGNYIAKKDKYMEYVGGKNYYKDIEKEYKLSTDKVEKLKKDILSNEYFYTEIESEEKMTEIIYDHHLNVAEWIMIVSLPKSVISETTSNFMMVVIAMIVVLVLTVTLAGIIFVRLFMETFKAKSEARARTDFLSTMSHEIRTPLNGIIGLNTLMSSSIDDKVAMAKYVEEMSSTAKYLLTLVNDILDMSKLQSDNFELIKCTFSMKNMISKIDFIMRSRMEKNNIKFNLKTNIIYDSVIGDETRIEQIIVNILENAAKFTKDGGHVEFSINQMKVTEDEVETVFTIKDNGIGMTQEFQKHIFDAFSQEINSNTAKCEGTGLGMSISASLAKLMNGQLLVDSRLDEGSEFIFKLKLKISEEESEPVVTVEAIRKSEASDKKINILLVEDNETNGEILIKLLKLKGYDVIAWAQSGKDAVKKFEESDEYTYDLILMDIHMPDISGYDVTKTIRMLPRMDAASVKIFACSANVFAKHREMAKESGMDDFITKPIDINKLVEKIEAIY